MYKARNKKFSLLMAIVFAFTMIFPFAGVALAGSDYKVLTVPTFNVSNSGVESANLGAVLVEITPGSVKAGQSFTLKLSEDITFGSDPVVTTSDSVYGDDHNYILIPNKYDGEVNGLEGASFDVTQVSSEEDKDEFKFEVTGTFGTDNRVGYFYIYLNDIVIEKNAPDGEITLTVDPEQNSGFSGNDLVVGNVTEGEVTVSVEDDCNITDDGEFSLRFKENSAGALEAVSDSIVVELPDGFEFKSTAPDVEVIWGDIVYDETDTNAYTIKEDEIQIGFKTASDRASCVEITFYFEVEDETDVEYGDIEVDLGDSESDIDPTTLIVGTYGDYDATIEVEEATEVLAGMHEQEIGKIIIKESSAQSLIKGRTVLLTLPDNARWVYESLNGNDFEEDENLDLIFDGLIGTDDRTAKFKVKTDSLDNDPAEIYLEEAEVYLEAGETGDLVVEVGGSAGLDGELVVANVVAPISVEASSVPNVKIGLGAQEAGDITITEVKAEALIEGEELVLELPEDVEWSGEPEVEVIEGDLEISGIDIDDEFLTIDIDEESDEASTIKISGIKYSLYRTIPEGDIEVKITGPAVVETVGEVDEDLDGDGDSEDEEFDFNTEDAATVVNASCGTPAPEDEKLSTTITLGDNGSYISDGRIMVQLRDAATALGVEEQNIFWDGPTKSATFIKGDRVVQITVGDKQVKLNGVPLPTDKGAELKDGRTYVALSAAGVALGAVAEWDNTAKTATLTIE